MSPRQTLCGWVCVAVALAAGCSTANQAAPAPVVEVQAATVRRQALAQWVRAPGVLYPLRQAIITPKISAPVSRFLVNRGDPVQAGELVAELENRDLAAAARQAQGQLETAEAVYQTAIAGTIPADLKKAQLDAEDARKALANSQSIYDSRQALFAQGAIPRRDLDQAGVDLTNAKNASALAQQHLEAVEASGHAQALKAAQGALATAQAQAQAAEAALGYSEIHSPIAGVVADRPIYPGELATPSSPLMTIMDLSQVVARLHVPGDQAALLTVGDVATLAAPGGETPLRGTVTVVSPATDPSSTTIEIWVQARNPGAGLRPGTSVGVAILARTLPQALVIPSSALLTDTSGATSVMVVGADGKAHQTNVTVGVREPDAVQILSGVKAGDTVVTVGAYGLPDLTQVKIVAPPPAPAGG